MKKLSKIAAVALVAGFALTGCSQNVESSDSDARSEAREVFREFQEVAAENSESVATTLTEVTTKVNTSLDVVELKKLNSEEPLLERYGSLEPENQSKIAKIYTDADPVSEFYSYENMNDAEKATAGLISLLITSFTDEKDAEAVATISDDDITVTDPTHVIINYTDPDGEQLTTSREVHMVKDGDTWKLDAKKMVEMFNTANAAPQE